VSVVGGVRARAFRFPEDLGTDPMILPGRDSAVRTEFDALCARLGVSVHVQAEVDDMATMRLVARDTRSLALLPSVVVRDELRQGVLVEHCAVPGLFEVFYAVTVERHFQHPLVSGLLERGEAELLGNDPGERHGV
jgi:LysR family transcriptional regulator, transcriptional activator of nhaA